MIIYNENIDYKQLPVLQIPGIQWLWCYGYWDGPFSGLVQYEEKKFWCQMIDEDMRIINDDDFVRIRNFIFIELLPEQLSHLEEYLKLVKEMVNANADYVNGKEQTSEYRSQELIDKFHHNIKPKMPKVDLSANIVIGWYSQEDSTI